MSSATKKQQKAANRHQIGLTWCTVDPLTKNNSNVVSFTPPASVMPSAQSEESDFSIEVFSRKIKHRGTFQCINTILQLVLLTTFINNFQLASTTYNLHKQLASTTFTTYTNNLQLASTHNHPSFR